MTSLSKLPELNIFRIAYHTRQILHFKDKETGERYKAFIFGYYYGYLYDQTNYCIIYDIKNKMIKAIPLYRAQDIYLIKQKFNPSDRLMEQLQEYADNCNFEVEVSVEVE